MFFGVCVANGICNINNIVEYQCTEGGRAEEEVEEAAARASKTMTN